MGIISTDQMTKKLTDVAKTGARIEIEREKVSRLHPIVLIALEDDEIKMIKLSARENSHLKASLESCLKHYDAHTYAFIYECDGTEFPEALLMAKGTFGLLSDEDKYRVVTLQACTKGSSSIFISRAEIEAEPGKRTVSEWVDTTLEEESQSYVTDW